MTKPQPWIVDLGCYTAVILLLFAWASAAKGAPMVPLDAAALAARDLEAKAPDVREQRVYIWCPTGSKEEQVAAALITNFAINRTSVDVIPKSLFGGKLAAVDLRLCANSEEEFQELRSLWASLSDREPYFHVPVDVVVKVEPYVHTDGKTYTGKRKRVGLPAPHLGELGLKLEQLVGNPLPDQQSFCPIIRVGWAAKELLGTADGARYYDFRGFDRNETLEEYLVRRGASKEQAKRLESDERAASISSVSAKARGYTVLQGAGTRPSVGAQIIAITDDPLDDTVDPQKDPFRELLDSKTDGHEVLVTLPNGWIEYSIWDGNERLVDEAPPNLVADHRIPKPYTTRLHGAMSCIRCHAANDQWMPFKNEVALMLGDSLDVLGDANAKDGVHDTLRRLAGLYSGDLGHVIKQAQDNFNRRCFAVTGLGAAEACQMLAAVHDRYEYEYVTAAMACRELGFDLLEGDALGVDTFRQAVPPQTPEDPIVGRYRVQFLDAETGEQSGLKNTRRTWELIFADAMQRAMPQLIQKRKAENQ